MISQFPEYSSWREQDINIEPYTLGTMDFLQTNPNIFVIQNPNNASVKVGISKIPTAERYEFQIEKNTTESVGRPIGTHQIYFYNDSSNEISLKVYSLESDFDLSILNNLAINLEHLSIESGNMKLDGFAEGVSLPGGSNEIGRVSLNASQFITFTNVLSELQNIKNNLNNYAVNNFKNKWTDEKITELFNYINGLPLRWTDEKITELLNAINSISSVWTDEKITELFSKIESISGTGSTESKAESEKEYYYNATRFSYVNGETETVKLVIDTLINDGTQNLYIMNEDGEIIWGLKSGEFVNDMVISVAVGEAITIEYEDPDSEETYRLICHTK